jgi:hypothetical protein
LIIVSLLAILVILLVIAAFAALRHSPKSLATLYQTSISLTSLFQ